MKPYIDKTGILRYDQDLKESLIGLASANKDSRFEGAGYARASEIISANLEKNEVKSYQKERWRAAIMQCYIQHLVLAQAGYTRIKG